MPEISWWGEQLRRMRDQADLSQSKLASILGVTKQHISAVENGRTGISTEKAQQWVEACGLSLRDLFIERPHESEVMQNLDHAPNELLLALLALSAIQDPSRLMTVYKFARVVPQLSGDQAEIMAMFIDRMAASNGISFDDDP